MPVAIRIQRATVADSPRLAPLFDAYRRFYGLDGNLDSARAFLEERISREESVVYFASASPEGAPIGFVQLYPSFSSLSMRACWILNDLFVEPGTRRAGTGRALMLRAAEHAQETRSKGLTLKTATDNAAAQRLYESLGWVRDDRYVSYDLRVDL